MEMEIVEMAAIAPRGKQPQVAAVLAARAVMHTALAITTTMDTMDTAMQMVVLWEEGMRQRRRVGR